MDGLDRLSAAIDGLEADGWESADLPHTLLALHRLTHRMQALLLRATADFDASGRWADDGALSSASWLRANTRSSMGAARRDVRDARLLRDTLQPAAEALAAGHISREHVMVLTQAVEATPERCTTLSAAAPILVEAAGTLDPHGLRRVVDHWTNVVDPVGAGIDEKRRFARRRLSISRTFNGMVALDALLDPENGATVMAAIESLSAPAGLPADDSRTAGQRRADALVTLARTCLSRSGSERPAPRRNGRSVALAVTVDIEVLRRQSGTAELDRAGNISAAAALRLACDAELTPVLLQGREPLDVGRSRRLVPLRLRRALELRDGGCRFAGCDRPHAWCDAHHIVPWAAGGRTDLRNLVLLCEPHHRAVHEGGFRLRLGADGSVATRRADGSLIGPGDGEPP